MLSRSLFAGASRLFVRRLATATTGARVLPTQFRSASHQLRNFSATGPNHSALASALTAALDSEIDSEKKLEKEISQSSNKPLEFPGFNVKTNDAEVRLTKAYGTEQILVVFNVNHSVDIDEDAEETGSPPLPIALPPFTIEITKGNERLCFEMLLSPTAEPNAFDFRVEEFYVAPAIVGDNEDVDPFVYASSGKYVDEALNDLLFDQYLGERGFTPEFCRTLVEFATRYEHLRYVNLLEKIKAFVAKK